MTSIYPSTTSNSTFPNGSTELPEGIGAAIEATKPLVEKFTAMQGQTLENVTALSQHWSNFVNVRAQENMNLSRQLTECKSPVDFHTALADYWKAAASHYQTGFMQAATVIKTETAAHETTQRQSRH